MTKFTQLTQVLFKSEAFQHSVLLDLTFKLFMRTTLRIMFGINSEKNPSRYKSKIFAIKYSLSDLLSYAFMDVVILVLIGKGFNRREGI